MLLLDHIDEMKYYLMIDDNCTYKVPGNSYQIQFKRKDYNTYYDKANLYMIELSIYTNFGTCIETIKLKESTNSWLIHCADEFLDEPETYNEDKYMCISFDDISVKDMSLHKIYFRRLGNFIKVDIVKGLYRSKVYSYNIVLTFNCTISEFKSFIYCFAFVS